MLRPSTRKSIVACLTALAVGTLMLVNTSSASGAQAQRQYTPQEVCNTKGSGYTDVVYSENLTLAGHGVGGTFYVVLNPRTHQQCITTIRAPKLTGYLSFTEVQAGTCADKDKFTDKGQFQFYAGPLYVGTQGLPHHFGEVATGGGKLKWITHDGEC